MAGVWAILQYADWIVEDMFKNETAMTSVCIADRTFALLLLLFLGALSRQDKVQP